MNRKKEQETHTDIDALKFAHTENQQLKHISKRSVRLKTKSPDKECET